MAPVTDNGSLNQIQALMQAYFEGLYQADSSLLAEVFHPDARYVNLQTGDYMHKSMSEYFAMVDQRTSPASQQATRCERILSVELGGSQMAFVKAEMTMFGRRYLDFLTLSSDQHGWRIMNKSFIYGPLQHVASDQ